MRFETGHGSPFYLMLDFEKSHRNLVQFIKNKFFFFVNLRTQMVIRNHIKKIEVKQYLN